MKNRLTELYENHQNHDVTFNQNVIKSLGLVVESIVIKCGDIKVPCIIYSSTLVGTRIIINLSERKLNYIKRKRGSVSLYFNFKAPYTKREISFYINSKVTDFDHYNDDSKKDFYYCSLEFTGRAPDDLISILGEHIDKQINMHKRAEERFILKNGDKDLKQSLKNYLFISGKAKKCILTEISLFSAKLILVGNIKNFKINDTAMLITQCSNLDGTCEMLGKIERTEVILEEEHIFSIILKFNQELIPPSYKLWIAEFLEVANIKKH